MPDAELGSDISVPVDTTSYIDEKLHIYEKYDLQDLDLWESFQEDFKNFTPEIFAQATRPVLLMLRKFLRQRGVYVLKKARYPIAQSLVDTIQETEQTEWSESQINEHLRLDGQFVSHTINHRIKSFQLSESVTDIL